ncbi:MAG: uL15 family ribosomal protein [Candidatus Jorgensenbacteria bacterium]|nr:uL15 family ribosomal protein [Candidatus Jorgensenbacteria bacterium]
MQLHTIVPQTKKRGRKRIGRGGKRGTYSGRGQKGQGSRAGHRIRPAERDLIMRLPKLRGSKRKIQNVKPIAISVGELERKMKDTNVTKATLLASGLIKEISISIKLLGGGEVRRAFTIKGIRVSESAKKQIEAAGGSVKK